jgi:hypothetical protein
MRSGEHSVPPAAFRPAGPSFHAAERWAAMVRAAIAAPSDPRTLAKWARLLALSESTLRARCYQARVSPRRSLALARVLRAAELASQVRCRLDDLLDTRDPRTLRRLLLDAGIACHGRGGFGVTSAAILNSQTLVGAGPALAALRECIDGAVDRPMRVRASVPLPELT